MFIAGDNACPTPSKPPLPASGPRSPHSLWLRQGDVRPDRTQACVVEAVSLQPLRWKIGGTDISACHRRGYHVACFDGAEIDTDAALVARCLQADATLSGGRDRGDIAVLAGADFLDSDDVCAEKIEQGGAIRTRNIAAEVEHPDVCEELAVDCSVAQGRSSKGCKKQSGLSKFPGVGYDRQALNCRQHLLSAPPVTVSDKNTGSK